MKLYATTISERASKGQGGNKRLDILVSDSERFEVAKLYFQINEDNTATLNYWDRTMTGDGFTSTIHLSKSKKKKDENIKCNNCDWRGKEEELKISGDIELCPKCELNSEGKLMDI